ncbi:hypothetical protein KUTeg_016597 [Tegillarca granosa]|uniref:Uncharacterized protein n=1 Tax=Tegillarca granosa TaxID=220873 RepID=A0ABQ9ELA7_TEGGR|nr:hypothetical protein KUTeg_016597 [Tegillarca granosa]
MGSLDMTVSMIVTVLTTNVTLMVHVLVLNAKTDGVKVNDPMHPDYVPSLFPHKENNLKSNSSINRLNRVRKRAYSTATDTTKARKKLRLLDMQSELPEKEVELGKNTLLEIPDISENVPCSPLSLLSETEIRPLQTPLQPSEREMLYEEINNLRAERDTALEKIKELEKLVNASTLSPSSVEGNNDACKNLTGLSWDIFLKLFLFLSTFTGNGQGSTLPLKDQLFITLSTV